MIINENTDFEKEYGKETGMDAFVYSYTGSYHSGFYVDWLIEHIRKLNTENVSFRSALNQIHCIR